MHKLNRHTFTQFSTASSCVVTERKQFPSVLAYGLTIHISQAMTFDNVVVHCNGVFEPGQLSVAIGRVSSSEGLSLTGYRKGLYFQPKSMISQFYGVPSTPLSKDLVCCTECDIITINEETDTYKSDDDNSDFNEEELNE